MRRYESIAAASAEMAAAARRGDWDALIEAQNRCAALVESAQLMPEPQFDAEQRHCWADMVRTMLAEDAEVRELVHDRMTCLDGLLRGFRQSHELAKTYR